jgi:hypothetical protein
MLKHEAIARLGFEGRALMLTDDESEHKSL